MVNRPVVVGVPREVKTNEGRVGLTPSCAQQLVEFGAVVLIEKSAGKISGYDDEAYLQGGATIVMERDELWRSADLIVKVKEPVAEEYSFLVTNPGKVIFTYLHLAGVDPMLTKTLMESHWTSIAYETVTKEDDGKTTFPLLIPMSIIAGREAMLGALRRKIDAFDAVIIGCGHVGEAALEVALEEKLDVTVFESWKPRADELKEKYKHHDGILVLNRTSPDSPMGRKFIRRTDIVICGPMAPGGKESPIVLTANMHFRYMRPGTQIVDVSIDQGGSTEWTHNHPTKPGETFTKGARKLVFSAVPNIPGSTVPAEATKALTSVTYPYVALLVKHMMQGGLGEYNALLASKELRRGLMTWQGKLYNHHVATKLGLLLPTEYQDIHMLFQ